MFDMLEMILVKHIRTRDGFFDNPHDGYTVCGIVYVNYLINSHCNQMRIIDHLPEWSQVIQRRNVLYLLTMNHEQETSLIFNRYEISHELMVT